MAILESIEVKINIFQNDQAWGIRLNEKLLFDKQILLASIFAPQSGKLSVNLIIKNN